MAFDRVFTIQSTPLNSTRKQRGESMYRMDKLTTGIAYGASATNTGYWLLQLTDRVSPSQWAALGVIGSLVFGLLTYLTNLHFKIKEDRRRAARGE